LQVRQDLGLADHVWQDKRTLIAQSVDNLGDQVLPAMRAGWLSYIRRAYPEDNAADAFDIEVSYFTKLRYRSVETSISKHFDIENTSISK
jgi:hypothetical protein